MSESLVFSVISNFTGVPVLCCITVALASTLLLWEMSPRLSDIKSQPRNLLSMAKLNNAKSRLLPDCFRIVRIDHTSDALSGCF